MKIKDIFSPFLLIILGLAFIIISCWAFFSKNKNAKAVRYKYRLGGMILSLSFFASSCSNPSGRITCYDPAVPENTIYTNTNPGDSFVRGDTIYFSIIASTYEHYSYLLSDSVSQVKLQQGMMAFSEEIMRYILPLNTDLSYTGNIIVSIFGEETSEPEQTHLLYSEKFRLYAAED